MCGIFGAIHSKTADYKTRQALNVLIAEALQVGVVRGEDSSGIFQIRYDDKPVIHKVPYSGFYLADDPKAKALLTNTDVSLVTVVHHRAATRGSISAANAHPFQHTVGENTVTGVHNGHISNFKYKEDDIPFEVDSDWGLYQIAKQGGPEAIGEMEGAIALAWHQSNDKKLRLFTNGKRTLFWNYVKDQNIMLFASEHEMLYWLCSRNDIELEKTMWTGDEAKIYVFDPEKPREFDVEDIVKKEKPVVTSSARQVWPPYSRMFEHDDEALSDVWDYTPTNDSSNYSSTRKTYQGETISFDAAAIQEMGFKLGDVVDFYPDPESETTVVYNVVGDIMRELVGRDGKPSVDFIRSIMINTNQSVVDNLKKIIDNPGSECKCRVIGTSTINVAGKPQKCLILSRPLNMVIYENSLADLIIPVWDTVKVSKARFKELIKEGCETCGGHLSEEMAHSGKIAWFNKHPYCQYCADLPDTDSVLGPTAASNLM